MVTDKTLTFTMEQAYAKCGRPAGTIWSTYTFEMVCSNT